MAIHKLPTNPTLIVKRFHMSPLRGFGSLVVTFPRVKTRGYRMPSLRD